MIDISGIDKAELLAALYNASAPQGMGHLHFTPAPMTHGEARSLLDAMRTLGHELRFDYLKGRVMKVDITGDQLRPELYDRDLGHGACERVVESVRNRRVER